MVASFWRKRRVEFAVFELAEWKLLQLGRLTSIDDEAELADGV